ncbi:hypothetical protein AB0J28_00665 [Streptosporangium canum]|uniref:hypothetical protein n=1 Tax=Streptosporangium canum TaxID=324952 RepID=UPI00343A31C8
MAASRAPKPEPDEPLGQSVRDITPDVAPEAPPYYIATAPLRIGTARAHNVGDRVPVEHVEKYGWANHVRHPKTGEPFAPAPQTPPETNEGQASTEGKGDA